MNVKFLLVIFLLNFSLLQASQPGLKYQEKEAPKIDEKASELSKMKSELSKKLQIHIKKTRKSLSAAQRELEAEANSKKSGEPQIANHI